MHRDVAATPLSSSSESPMPGEAQTAEPAARAARSRRRPMSPRSFLPVAILISAALASCSRPEPPPQPLPTPAAIDAEFRALLETLDDDRPGAAVASLTEFLNGHRDYDIVPEVERQIRRLTSLASGRYHLAREFAREGEFVRAESILEDLATHLPETPDGKSAKQHLAFDFHIGKAQWLMVRQRWEEGEAVARLLLDRDLTRLQGEQVETILDSASQVGAALSQAAQTQVRAACRQLMILLETRYVEEGAYPSNLSLSDVESWDPIGSRSILRALSAIEDYHPTDRSYSFVAVGAGGQDRIRVVDGALED